MKFKYYLSLGSNIEPRVSFLQNAVGELGKIGKVVRKSAIYESIPWGNENQDNFLNAVVRFYSDLDPFSLLANIKHIEQKVGRKNSINRAGSERELCRVAVRGKLAAESRVLHDVPAAVSRSADWFDVETF